MTSFATLLNVALRRYMDKSSIMVFGAGELQRSITLRAKAMGLFVIGIDPCADAACKDDVDAFEVVGGQDYEKTVEVAEKYGISAIVTAATDKPLVMMAKVAETLGLPFFSEDTAVWSTDKFQMKRRFVGGGVPCARGKLIHHSDEAEDLDFPVICKPRDNSGSRGVKLCRSKDELQECIDEALQFSHMDTVLAEEFIVGLEYSIEALHYNGYDEVIQFTEKRTTPFPYNVELGHIQPADLTADQKSAICEIIRNIASCMGYKNCPSHTELKVNDRGIYVIETSPRLGGDYITSVLTPLSTGIDMEKQLLNIALGRPVDTMSGRHGKASGICFFSLHEGIVESIDDRIHQIKSCPDVHDFQLKLNTGDSISPITNSLNRYGHIIVSGSDRETVIRNLSRYEDMIRNFIKIR